MELLECDLGELPPETKVVRTIPLTNTTQQPLTIRSVQRDCLCVAEALNDRQILPGQTIQMRIEYLTPALPGRVEHAIRIEYHETDNTTVVLLSGVVGGWADVRPAELDFGDVCLGEASEREVAIRLREPLPLREATAVVDLEHAKLVHSAVDQAAKVLRYRLRFEPPPSAICKDYRGDLVVDWPTRNGRQVRVPCMGRAVPRWDAEPPAAFFGVVLAGEKRRLDIRLRARAAVTQAPVSQAWRLQSRLDTCFKATLATGTGPNAVVSVSLDAAAANTRGFVGGELAILDGGGSPILTIPVSAYIQ